MPDPAEFRPAAVAGQFYPGSPTRLRAEVEASLVSGAAAAGPVRALIVPHAGYQYSGRTAGHAYARLRQAPPFRRVVVLAPSHRAWFRGVSLGDYAGFTTPLGTVPVDTAACRALLAAGSRLVCARRDAHAAEHSLEVQLPFLQVLLPDAALVPVVCGEMGLAEVSTVAGILAAELWRPDTLWVVSSDFTHYGEAFGYTPFVENVAARLEELDRGAIDMILRRDGAGFLDYVNRTGATICGRLPIALLLAALERAPESCRIELCHYTTSGRLNHDYRHSVSYASLVVTAAEAGSGPDHHSGPVLGAAEKAALLTLAREAIGNALRGEPEPVPVAAKLAAALRLDAACFVTLHLDGRLRGCIGHLTASEPLYLNVIRNAQNAAFRDQRFSPLGPDEFERIEIEISVLTPARPISSADEFVVGRHGINLEKGRHRAVFLPQVAPEQGWDRETTLRHLCLKAGLGPNAWRRGASLSVFEAIVFADRDRGI